MPAVTQLRVRYKDTDTMAVAYYGNYLTYFEVGRVEYLRQADLPISHVDRLLHMPVVEAHVRYHKPARLDDLLTVSSRVSERKRASFTFSYEIRNEADKPKQVRNLCVCCLCKQVPHEGPAEVVP